MNGALLEELLGLLRKLNEERGVPQGGPSLSEKNILQNDSADPNNRVRPTLTSSERKRTSEIASLFAKTFFDFQKKTTKDTALKTSIQKITPKATSTQKVVAPKKQGSLWGGILALLGGVGALIMGLLTDGPFKGALKMLSKLGIQGGVKLLVDGVKGLISMFTKFVGSPFKFVGKLLSKGVFGKMFSALKPLAKILKKIPLIGSIISIGFAISRFSDKDNIGGVIDVLSALTGLLNLIPGGSLVAIPISIGLDMLNAWLDAKTANAPNKQQAKMDILKDMAKSVGKWIWKNALWLPVIGGFKRWSMAWDAFKGDNPIEGMKQFGLGLLSFVGLGPVITGIEMLMGFFSNKEASQKDLTPNTSWMSGMKNWIKKKLKDLPYFLRKPLEWFGILDENGDTKINMPNFDINMDGVKDFTSKSWEYLKEKISGMFNIFSNFDINMDGVKDFASKSWEYLKEKISGMFNIFSNIFNTVKENMPNIANNAIKTLEKIGSLLGNIFSKVLGALKKISISNLFSNDVSVPQELEEKARRAGHSSVDEYRKSGWEWKADKNTPTPILEQSGKSTKLLEKISIVNLNQLKVLEDIRNIGVQTLKAINNRVGQSQAIPIVIPTNNTQSPTSNNVALNSNRGDYGSSPYAFA